MYYILSAFIAMMIFGAPVYGANEVTTDVREQPVVNQAGGGDKTVTDKTVDKTAKDQQMKKDGEEEDEGMGCPYRHEQDEE